ncbi:unnamed protein product, partial [Brachionus calyciflorus]
SVSYSSSNSDTDATNNTSLQKRNLPQIEYQPQQQHHHQSNFRPYFKQKQGYRPNAPVQKNVEPQKTIQTVQKQNVLTYGPRNSNNHRQDQIIIGQAIANKTILSYLCDSGAFSSLINIATFRLLCYHDETTRLEVYNGPKLFALNGEINIYGVVRLNRLLHQQAQKIN